MTHESENKNLRDFLKKNETEIPGSPDNELSNIHRKIRQGNAGANKNSLWMWGPATATLMTLVAGIFITQNYFGKSSNQVANIEIAQMIWESYDIVDESGVDPLDDFYEF